MKLDGLFPYSVWKNSLEKLKNYQIYLLYILIFWKNVFYILEQNL